MRENEDLTEIKGLHFFALFLLKILCQVWENNIQTMEK